MCYAVLLGAGRKPIRRREFITLVGGAALGGTAAAWPLSARAQQKAMPVVGYLMRDYMPAPARSALERGLREAGYVVGQNVTVIERSAEGLNDRLPALADELVGRRVDVIVTIGGSPPARAAKAATSAIPIVFATGEDPVADGTVDSLARPGGNVTGISIVAVDLNPKRLELLGEAAPRAKAIALLVNPNNATVEHETRGFKEWAKPKGLRLDVVTARSEGEIDAAIIAIVQGHIDGLVVSSDPFFTNRRQQIVGLVARHGLPAIYAWREYVVDGGLISYGASLMTVVHQMGVYAGKILHGAKPADLPVEQPTKFELTINLKTARALGLTIPPTLLARADEVIE